MNLTENNELITIVLPHKEGEDILPSITFNAKDICWVDTSYMKYNEYRYRLSIRLYGTGETQAPVINLSFETKEQLEFYTYWVVQHMAIAKGLGLPDAPEYLPTEIKYDESKEEKS